MSERIIEQANEIVTNKAKRELDIAAANFKRICRSGKANSREDVIKAGIRANQWINFCAGEHTDLYDKYRFRLFQKNNKSVDMAQGDEIQELDVRRKNA